MQALPYLKHHAPELYVFVFIISAIESTPVIGTFTPGTIILIIFGIVASQNYANFTLILLSGFLGGMAGDLIGYYIGKYGKGFFYDHKGMFKYSHLETGKAFFLKHGGKSVCIGRFLGPIRAIISLLAGLFDLSFRRFIIWNSLGTFVWTAMYISLGYIFGKNVRFIEFWLSRASILISIIVIVGVYWYITRHALSKKDKTLL